MFFPVSAIFQQIIQITVENFLFTVTFIFLKSSNCWKIHKMYLFKIYNFLFNYSKKLIKA